MTQAQFASWLKTTLGFAGGYAVARGWISGEVADGIIGVALAAVPLLWGFLGNTTLAQIKQISELRGVQQVIVGPDAPPAVAAVAADPSVPKITAAPVGRPA